MTNNNQRADELFYSAVALMSSVLDGDTGHVRDEFRGETWGAIHRHLLSVAVVVSSLSTLFGDNIEETYDAIAHNAKARATAPVVGVSA
jgi:hypothetical protein